jgi:hypothetical protein
VIDIREGSESRGKILVLIDDEVTAKEIAADLRRRRCDVIVQQVSERRGLVSLSAGSNAVARVSNRVAAVAV